ncbi:MAG: CRISPR-associated helicase Cas3' [Chloroflexi bacterium]|nr:CRISPR-associated helicase Cas3' [Chloroflexota bacterium]
MARIDDATKKDRLDRMYLILSRNPRGLTEAEIADEVNLERRTANNYLRELEEQGKTFKDGIYWYPLVLRESRLRSFDLSPEEAVTLYLGARLLVKQQDKRNEPAETALLKLASVLKADAGVGGEIEQAARELAQRPVQENYQPIFREVVRGYIYRKRVEIMYHPLRFSKPFQTVFSTYLLEPSLIGFSTYLIGHSSIVNAMRAYKLERIISARIIKDDYSIPADFPGLEILRNAWSIITGEETTRVVLRFNNRVKTRVLETRWHPSQQTREDPQHPGSLLWEVQVADTLDLIPWVRSWGADCEVLEPKELRNALTREAQSLAELYKVVEMKKELFAHIREKDKTKQYLWDHLIQVSKDSGKFAGKIGLQKNGEVLGFLHDLGKASDKFQRYLLSGEGLIPRHAKEWIDPIANKGKIDHTTAGAQVIFEKIKNSENKNLMVAQGLALCIASHHSGLIDCLSPDGKNDFQRRIEKKEEEAHKNEAKSNVPKILHLLNNDLLKDIQMEFLQKINNLLEDGDSDQTKAFKEGLLLRFLLSCLLDADRLDAADFENPSNISIRNDGEYHPWKVLIERFNLRLIEFSKKENKNDVDELRDQVSKACYEFSTKPKGVYQLTVPTGGGKTLASLRFALNHAEHHSKSGNKIERIFYIIPYTSIIDQNADDVRKILEDKDENGKLLDRVVLEHHSNLTPDEETRRQSLLAQNWDAPIVFTTQVQFLEALFGSGTRSARRMHQLANSVIIFDEIQNIPVKCLHMFNVATRFLVRNCGASVVLCTATQPPLDQVGSSHRALSAQPIIRKENEAELFRKLKRVQVLDERGVSPKTDVEIADIAEQELQKKGSVLIVVNTKESARALYKAIAEKKIPCIHLYHLSTNMCPAHRMKVLNKIKGKLKSKIAKPVICVSTQLIEAGVDIDFGSVIRYLAGLNSITQAAGRCNRNGNQKDKDGKPTLGRVLIMERENEGTDGLEDITIGIDQAKRILGQFKANPEKFENDIIGLKAVAEYYKWYFSKQGEDKMKYEVGKKSPIGRTDNLFNVLSENKQAHDGSVDMFFKQSFLSAAKSFEVIDSKTQGVIVPYGEGKEIIGELKKEQDIEKRYKLLRRAQKYSINLYFKKFNQLRENGVIQEVQKDLEIYYMEEIYYDKNQLGWIEDPFMEV